MYKQKIWYRNIAEIHNIRKMNGTQIITMQVDCEQTKTKLATKLIYFEAIDATATCMLPYG